MLRVAVTRIAKFGQAQVRKSAVPVINGSFVRHSSGNMSDDPFPNAVERLEDPDIDGWDVRFIFDKIAGHQNVPEPDVVIAGLKACRRVNDFALTMRWLEVVHFKSQHNKAIWPYMVQEIRPTCDELGVSLPEDIGYDKPELSVPEEDYEVWKNNL